VAEDEVSGMTQDRESVENFMRAAIEQGKLALPACLPNAPVGRVLVRGAAIMAREACHVVLSFPSHGGPLVADVIERLARIAGMLGSAHEGERATAAQMASAFHLALTSAQWRCVESIAETIGWRPPG
jgi:hypothetical protein